MTRQLAILLACCLCLFVFANPLPLILYPCALLLRAYSLRLWIPKRDDSCWTTRHTVR